jgi:uncharacterized coiled-coil protein SlyX
MSGEMSHDEEVAFLKAKVVELEAKVAGQETQIACQNIAIATLKTACAHAGNSMAIRDEAYQPDPKSKSKSKSKPKPNPRKEPKKSATNSLPREELDDETRDQLMELVGKESHLGATIGAKLTKSSLTIKFSHVKHLFEQGPASGADYFYTMKPLCD